MGVLDFLFEGQAPPSVTTYGSTVANLPQWMSDYTQGLLGRANAIGAEPYQSYQGPRVAGFTPDTNRAFNLMRTNAGNAQGVLGQGQNTLAQAGLANPLGAANPFINQAQGALSAGTNNAGSTRASGMISGAGNSTFPGNANQYMNPYIDNVINRGANLATRNFNEKMLPGIQDMFTANGQYGSTRMAEEVMRGARDTTEGIQQNSNAALADAYQSGSSIFNQDQSRALSAGTSLGNLSEQSGSRQLQAGQQYGQLGQLAGNLETQRGQLGIDAAGRWGDIADQLNRLNLSDASGLEAIGDRQQGLNQTNLDTAFGDFNRQTQYPRDTVDWLSSVVRGLPSSRTTTTTDTGPNQSGTGRTPIEQIGGLAAILRGLRPQAPGGG